MSQLPTPFSLKGLTLKNRIVMAPMCQYSVEAKDGNPKRLAFCSLRLKSCWRNRTYYHGDDRSRSRWTHFRL